MSIAVHERALARWLAQGVTSRSHAILRHVLERLLEPLGIRADWLEAEPFSSMEDEGNGWWLRGARWDPSFFDRTAPAAADFQPILAPPPGLACTFDAQGILSLDGEGREAEELRSSEAAWLAVRHTVRASQEAGLFLHAAAGILLADARAATLYGAGDDAAFCDVVSGFLRGTTPPATAGDAGPRIPRGGAPAADR